MQSKNPAKIIKPQKQYLKKFYIVDSDIDSGIINLLYHEELNWFSLTHSQMMCPISVSYGIRFPV